MPSRITSTFVRHFSTHSRSTLLIVLSAGKRGTPGCCCCCCAFVLSMTSHIAYYGWRILSSLHVSGSIWLLTRFFLSVADISLQNLRHFLHIFFSLLESWKERPSIFGGVIVTATDFVQKWLLATVCPEFESAIKATAAGGPWDVQARREVMRLCTADEMSRILQYMWVLAGRSDSLPHER